MKDAAPGQRRIMGSDFNAAVSSHVYAESTRSRFERVDSNSKTLWNQWAGYWLNQYRVIPAHRNHRNDPASVFLSTHWWSQHPASQRWLFLVVSCFFKPLRNCHPSQRVLKVQCKNRPKECFYIEIFVGFSKRFYVFLRDFMLIFNYVYVFLRDFMLEKFLLIIKKLPKSLSAGF